jgi:hypothetical protein
MGHLAKFASSRSSCFHGKTGASDSLAFSPEKIKWGRGALMAIIYIARDQQRGKGGRKENG